MADTCRWPTAFAVLDQHATLAEVRFMLCDWTPGRRVSKLPRFLQPPALLARNILRLPQAWRNHRREWHSENAREIRKHLALSVEYVCGADVAGDLAEFGTMTGRTATDLARALAARDSSRRLFLFDSFQGLPEPTSPIDQAAPHVQQGVWTPGACRGISKPQLFRLCRRYLSDDRLLILDGWFADTLPTVPAGTRFALLHIDSDLYQSAWDVLEGCFSRGLVSPGAAILFDDWDCNRADPGCGERRAWSEAVHKFGIEFSDCGQYGWGSRKVLVHSYQSTRIGAVS
jgi:O-methyltransferase